MRSRTALVTAQLLVLLLVILAASLVYRNRTPRVDVSSQAPEMVRIPAGSFLMGSPPTEPFRSPQETRHEVSVSSFLLGRFPVTQAQWQSVMGVNPSYFRGDSRLPVEGVTWYDAVAFCNWLSLKAGLKPCYQYEGVGADPSRWPTGWKQSLHDHIRCDWGADGFRLPTEAEWEYACRAGTATATAFGNTLTSRQANFNGEEPYETGEKGPNLRRTTPVGSYPPNAWGLYDMHGNVTEWCWDWFADYDPAKAKDPRGPSELQKQRVFRGGSWFSHGSDVRSAARFGDAPFFRLDMLPGGLRLARNGN
jgi:formylglycine-generating enzyme required for sulfatase activity